MATTEEGQRSGVVTVGCACTGGTSSLRCRWPWQQPFITAVMWGPCRTTLYGARRLPGRRPRTALRGARRRVWPGIPSSSRCMKMSSGARGLTGCTRSGRRNGFSGTPWERSSTTRSSCRRLTFLCRRWKTSWWTYAGFSMSSFPSRLLKCPRSRLHPVLLAGAVCASLSRRQNSWWKYRRSSPILLYSGLWSRTSTFQFLVVEGNTSVFKVFSQDSVQQRCRPLRNAVLSGLWSRAWILVCLVEVLQRLLRVLVNTLVKGFFGLFPELKKVRSWARTRGRNCPPSRAHPR